MKLFTAAFNRIGSIFNVPGKCKSITSKPNKGNSISLPFHVEKGYNLQFINMEGGNVAMLTYIFIICKA